MDLLFYSEVYHIPCENYLYIWSEWSTCIANQLRILSGLICVRWLLISGPLILWLWACDISRPSWWWNNIFKQSEFKELICLDIFVSLMVGMFIYPIAFSHDIQNWKIFLIIYLIAFYITITLQMNFNPGPSIKAVLSNKKTTNRWFPLKVARLFRYLEVIYLAWQIHEAML